MLRNGRALPGRSAWSAPPRRRAATVRLWWLAAAGLFALLSLPIKLAVAAPQPDRAATPAFLTIEPRHCLGSARAPIGIVEFSDLQCPFCRRSHQGTLSDLKARYIDTGKVRFCYRDFPLDGHALAAPAAVAARCAGHQGAYWRMLDALFARQRELGRPLYVALASELKLDPAVFKACLKSSQEAESVRSDARYGQRLKVDRTPYFFIGKLAGSRLLAPQPLPGTQPSERFRLIIEELSRP
jgi:protein-disulfide isomerase